MAQELSRRTDRLLYEYFHHHDGHLWEVAWKPHWTRRECASLFLNTWLPRGPRTGLVGAILFSDIVVVPHALGQEVGRRPSGSCARRDATSRSGTDSPQVDLPEGSAISS